MTPTTMSRLATAPAYAVLPAEDLARARSFYHDTLGLEVRDDSDMTGFTATAGGGTQIYVYQRARTKAEHTALMFHVEDLDATMSDLKSRGIHFEDYDLPNVKTVNGIAESPEARMAWFVDPEGNIVGIGEMRMPMM